MPHGTKLTTRIPPPGFGTPANNVKRARGVAAGSGRGRIGHAAATLRGVFSELRVDEQHRRALEAASNGLYELGGVLSIDHPVVE